MLILHLVTATEISASVASVDAPMPLPSTSSAKGEEAGQTTVTRLSARAPASLVDRPPDRVFVCMAPVARQQGLMYD